jgi:hypothetical protein
LQHKKTHTFFNYHNIYFYIISNFFTINLLHSGTFYATISLQRGDIMLKKSILILSIGFILTGCAEEGTTAVNNSTPVADSTNEATTENVTLSTIAATDDISEITTASTALTPTEPTTTATTTAVATVQTADPVPSATIGERNAVNAAKNYVSIMGFSYNSLVEQLKFEGYTDSEATYGANNCGADWNEECAESASNYLSTMSFSRESLKEQLEYEGFTASQIEYGLSSVGY